MSVAARCQRPFARFVQTRWHVARAGFVSREQFEQDVPVARPARGVRQIAIQRALPRILFLVDERPVRPPQRTQPPQRDAQLMQGFGSGVGVDGGDARERFVDEGRRQRGERRFGMRLFAQHGDVVSAIVVFHVASYRERRQDDL